MRKARLAIGLGLAVVIAGLLFFALVGIQQYFRGTPVHQVVAVGRRGGVPAVTAPAFARALRGLTGVDLEPGHAAEVLLNGDATFPRLWRDLRAARSTVTLRVYYAEPGAVADSLSAVLRERAAAGVRVLFLYDAFGSSFSDAWLAALRAGGVEVAAFRPLRWYSLNRAQNRSHVRAVVIDGQVGYTGGFGIADKWLGDGRRPGHWRDTNVRFVGPAVLRLQGAFAAGWAEATGELLTGESFFPPVPTAPAGPPAGLLYAVPGPGSTDAERLLALSVAGARRSLFVTSAYFLPDDDQRRLLVDAARRGVDVRVLTAGRRTDVALVRLASRAHFEQLLRGGVRVYEYRPAMIHAKTLVVDGRWTSIGSMNFDNRSAALNEESNLLLLDARTGARMDSVFLADLRLAREIRLPDFERRPWYDRILERAATLARRSL